MTQPAPGIHVWLTGPADAQDPTTRRAALLVEWHQRPDGWWARIVYVAQLRAGRTGLVEEWVPATQVTPA